LLEDEPSIWAAQYGMTVGLYTGKKLSDYFNDKRTDPLGARDIINSGDRAALITTYYKSFLNGLMA
jgi:putative chitinase